MATFVRETHENGHFQLCTVEYKQIKTKTSVYSTRHFCRLSNSVLSVKLKWVLCMSRLIEFLCLLTFILVEKVLCPLTICILTFHTSKLCTNIKSMCDLEVFN